MEREPLLSIIVAVSENNAIGRDNKLLWHLPDDLKYFKKTTSGSTVIMGRKTWESIGRPLPQRRNIVVSSKAIIPGVEVYGSLYEAIDAAKASSSPDPENPGEIFIIGGAEIYKQSLPFADKIYLTVVNQTITDADTFFPEIDHSQWIQKECELVEYGKRVVLVKKQPLL